MFPNKHASYGYKCVGESYFPLEKCNLHVVPGPNMFTRPNLFRATVNLARWRTWWEGCGSQRAAVK